MTTAKSSGAGSSKSVKSTALAEDAVEPHPGSAPEPNAASTDPLFDVPAVKEALFLLLGGGLDDAGKEKWLAYRLERGVDAEYVFGEALEMLGGMVAA